MSHSGAAPGWDISGSNTSAETMVRMVGRWTWPREHKITFAGVIVAVVAGVVIPLATTGSTKNVGNNSGTNNGIINNGTINVNVPPAAAPGKVTAVIGPSSSSGGLAQLSAQPVEYSFYPDRAGYLCGGSSCTIAPSPTLDSAVDNPVVGDERPFLCGSIDGGLVQNRINVKPGDIVTLRIYINNDATPAHLGLGPATANNVRLSVLIPTTERPWFNLVGFVTASNTTPATINDAMLLVGSQLLKALFVPGSAKFSRIIGGRQTESPLNDSIVSSAGVSLGDVAPGTANAGFVTMALEVVAA
jgi:hypothetical protein